MHLCFFRLRARRTVWPKLCGRLFPSLPRGFPDRAAQSAVGFVRRREWAQGTSDLRPSHSLRRRGLFTEKGEDLLAGPTQSSQSHIPRDAFPTPTRTHHSVLSWQIAREVGDHMSGDLPCAHGRADLQQTPQSGNSPQVRGNMERASIWEKGLALVDMAEIQAVHISSITFSFLTSHTSTLTLASYDVADFKIHISKCKFRFMDV